MKRKTWYIGIISVLSIIVICLVVLCLNQYDELQRKKIENLNAAFYYMQEVLEDETKSDFKDWDTKSAHIYILQGYIADGTNKMGDYDEIRDLILRISQIEDPSQKEAAKLIEKARKMRVSWNIGEHKYQALIIQ